MNRTDAHEFLQFLLDQLHSEWLELQRAGIGSGPSLSDASSVDVKESEEEWQEVGKKNRTRVVRSALDFQPTPVSLACGGSSRLTLTKKGACESVSFQPFFIVPLDMAPSLSEALRALSHRDAVAGLRRSDRDPREVPAFQSHTLERLPPLLIFQLKRFVWPEEGRVAR